MVYGRCCAGGEDNGSKGSPRAAVLVGKLSSVERAEVGWAVDGTVKRVTGRLGGGQRSPVTPLGLGGVVGRGRGFSTVVCRTAASHAAVSPIEPGHRHPCASMGGFPPSYRAGEKKVGAYQGTLLECMGCGCGCWRTGWCRGSRTLRFGPLPPFPSPLAPPPPRRILLLQSTCCRCRYCTHV